MLHLPVCPGCNDCTAPCIPLSLTSVLGRFLQVPDVTLGSHHDVAVRAVRAVCTSSEVHVAWFEPYVGAGTVTTVVAPEGAVFSSFATFGFATTAAPGTVSFEYTLDGSSWAPTAASLRLGPLSPGPHALDVRSKSSDGTSVSANHSVVWTVLSQSSYQLQLDLADGDHTLRVQSTDALGHVEASPAEKHFTVDTAPPFASVVVETRSPSSEAAMRARLSCSGTLVCCCSPECRNMREASCCLGLLLPSSLACCVTDQMRYLQLGVL